MREPRGTRALGGDEGTENSLSAACGHSEKPGPPTRKWASPRCQPRRPPWHPVTTGQATAPRAQTVHGQASQGDPGGTEGTHSWLRRSRPPAEGREEDPGGKAAAAAAQSSQTKRTSAAAGNPGAAQALSTAAARTRRKTKHRQEAPAPENPCGETGPRSRGEGWAGHSSLADLNPVCTAVPQPWFSPPQGSEKELGSSEEWRVPGPRHRKHKRSRDSLGTRWERHVPREAQAGPKPRRKPGGTPGGSPRM